MAVGIAVFVVHHAALVLAPNEAFVEHRLGTSAGRRAGRAKSNAVPGMRAFQTAHFAEAADGCTLETNVVSRDTHPAPDPRAQLQPATSARPTL
jgi:hypothetical protein